eukprot:TRINITY_DN90216_c0_g1_i1.p1 TRINITY_DN90216_c0_g1~~TRINITY_DN90216_c0_g1_i1.p1  ORF type:complete len:584 (-),score=99.11 TRINITY_DN90216_c0_g1_i1:436-2187(-)
MAAMLMQAAAMGSVSCRCTHPEPCFLNAPWHELEALVSLHDIQQVDFAAPGPQNMNETDVLWLSQEPGAMQYSGGMGSRREAGWAVTNSSAAKVVRLRSAEDASEAIKFATAHNIEVSVKATGHDFYGRSTKPGSLLLWTHQMKNITWNDEMFTPEHCTEAIPDTVTLGAGVQYWEIYAEAPPRGRLFVGGTCSTVGHVGAMLGGGYGDYSRMYGSGATNLVEAEVVLADGRVVKANACGPHSDLFHALRGGGGAFGLVTQATYRTHAWPEKQVGELEQVEVDLDVLLRWYANITKADKAKHFGGQSFVAPTGAALLAMTYVGLDIDACDQLVAPLGTSCFQTPTVWPTADAKESKWGLAGWYPSWEHPLGYIVASDHRYFRLQDIEGRRRQQFRDALVSMATYDIAGQGVTIAFNYVLGYSPAEVLAEAARGSTHPDVLQAIGVVKILSGLWNYQPGDALLPDSDTPIIESYADNFQRVRAELDVLLPEAGGYYHETSHHEDRWQMRFWGNQYRTLLDAKATYDPTNVFNCHHCVGSEFLAECALTEDDEESNNATANDTIEEVLVANETSETANATDYVLV